MRCGPCLFSYDLRMPWFLWSFSSQGDAAACEPTKPLKRVNSPRLRPCNLAKALPFAHEDVHCSCTSLNFLPLSLCNVKMISQSEKSEWTPPFLPLSLDLDNWIHTADLDNWIHTAYIVELELCTLPWQFLSSTVDFIYTIISRAYDHSHWS